MTAFWIDLRVALRMLIRARGFTLAAVAALALGIGPNTAIFSIVYATLLAPLPYPDPGQLVMVWSKVQNGRNIASAGDYLEWKSRASTFQYLEAFSPRVLNLGTPQGPEHVRARATTADGYRMLGEPIWLGRDFTAEDTQPGKDQVVILSHVMWRDHYGADRDIIGRQIRMDSKPYTVIGVMPPGPSDRLPAKVWTPLALTADQHSDHDAHWLLVTGRLKPGVTLQQAQQQMNGIADDLAQRFPKSNAGFGISVEPLQNDFLDRGTVANLWLLLAAVSFVVLIACVNVANLLLARGIARGREMALRTSLGASHAQLFRQVLTESLALALVGGLAGVFLSVWILQGVMALLPTGALPAEVDARLSVPVLLFTLLTTVLCGVLFGCVPAWQAGRVDLAAALKQGGRTLIGSGHRGVRQTLVLVEFALAVALLAGAGLTIHSFWNRTQADLGIQTDHVLTFSLPVQQGRLKTSSQIAGFYRDLLGRVRALPGVTHVAAATGVPVLGSGFGTWFTIVGRPAQHPGQRTSAAFRFVTPDYFQAFGVRLLSGRAFTEHDDDGGPRVAVVNERFVERYLTGLDPLQQRLLIAEVVPPSGGPAAKVGAPVEWQIVGVFHDITNGDRIGDPDRPEIYVPFWQSPWPQASIAVRTTVDPDTMRQSIAAVVNSLDPDLPLANATTMTQLIGEWLSPDRFNVALYGGLASVALLLAVLGLYGVMAFLVAQRTQEIGIRMALGAEQRQVRLQVLREGLRLAVGGLLIGLVGAYVVGRLMQHLLYGTSALDAIVLLPVGALLLASALAACYVPARRASLVDPIVALRQE
jgi:putative ABC transport system permease protein